MPTTDRVKLINQKELAALPLNSTKETFIVYIAIVELPGQAKMPIHFFPVVEVQIPLLQANRAPIEILSEYADYADIFYLIWQWS